MFAKQPVRRAEGLETKRNNFFGSGPSPSASASSASMNGRGWPYALSTDLSMGRRPAGEVRFWELDLERVIRALNVNALGALLCMRAALGGVPGAHFGHLHVRPGPPNDSGWRTLAL